MARFKFWMVILGIVFGVIGYQELRLTLTAKASPQEIDCAALEANGPGGNAHVTVANFMLSPGTFVYESTKSSSKWRKVWIPVVALESEYAQMVQALPEEADAPAPEEFRVILYSKDVENDADMLRIAQQDTFTGLVINEIDSLDSDTRKILTDGYPGIDLDKVWIVEHNRAPKGMVTSLLWMTMGLGLVITGIYFFVTGGKSRQRR